MYPKNRRLNDSQLNEVSDLVNVGMSPNEIQHYISVIYGVQLTRHDTRRLIDRCRSDCESCESPLALTIQPSDPPPQEDNQVCDNDTASRPISELSDNSKQTVDGFEDADSIINVVRTLAPNSAELACLLMLTNQFSKGRSVQDSLCECLKRWGSKMPSADLNDTMPPQSCLSGKNPELDFVPQTTTSSAALADNASILRSELCRSTSRLSSSLLTASPALERRSNSFRAVVDNSVMSSVKIWNYFVPPKNPVGNGGSAGSRLLKDSRFL